MVSNLRVVRRRLAPGAGFRQIAVAAVRARVAAVAAPKRRGARGKAVGLRGPGANGLLGREPQTAPDESFQVEILELFLELERTPGGHLPFTEGSHRLAELLGLTSE